MGQEKNFENKIKRYLAAKGCYFVKYHGNAYSTNGTPDILASVNGYFVGIEVKAQNGKPTELQLKKIRDIRESGGFAWVVYPSGWDKFKLLIDGICKEIFSKETVEVLK